MPAQTLSDILSEAARRHREHLAIRSHSHSISYAALNARVTATAAQFQPWLSPGDRVVVAAPNSIGWVLACLGASRAGAIPVPLDPAVDDRILSAVLEETAPAVIAGSATFLDRVGGYEVRQLLVEADRTTPLSPLEDPSVPLDFPAAAPDDLALISYTSGTTGTPRGVMLSHRNLIVNAEAAIEAAALRPDDVGLVVLPLHHTFTFTVGCLGAMRAGITIALEPRPSRLAARLRTDRPTLVLGVPVLFEAVLRAIRRRFDQRRVTRWYMQAAIEVNRRLVTTLGINAARLLFPMVPRGLGGRLRYAISGGAALSPDTVRLALLLGIPIMQGYGLSEASPVVSVQRYQPRRFWWSRHYWRQAGSAGNPLQGVNVEIQPGPDALPDEGEVVVSGDSVMLGYYRRPEATAAAVREGRLHTGDLGRLDDYGELWITGRARFTVKTPGGEFVNLERIEATLAASPAVHQVALLVEPEPRWQLVAVVFPAPLPGDDQSEAALRAELHRAILALPVRDRPREVRLTDAPLPATALGKIRRAEVPPRPAFDPATWRQAAAAFAASCPGQETAEDAPAGSPRDAARTVPEAGAAPAPPPSYRFPTPFVARWLATAPLGPRNAGADARRLLAGRTPAPRVLDAEYIPADGPFIIVMNHYERRGLRVWWPALLVTSAVWERRGETPPVRWLVTDRFYRFRVGPLRLPDRAVALLLRLVARQYGLIAVARDAAEGNRRSAALLAAEQALRAPAGAARPVGVTPEAAASRGSALARAWRNAGVAVAWLSQDEVPVLPVAVYEDEDGALIARFGPPYTLARPRQRMARSERDALLLRVMEPLAALLPPHLRGPYAVSDSPEVESGKE